MEVPARALVEHPADLSAGLLAVLTLIFRSGVHPLAGCVYRVVPPLAAQTVSAAKRG